MPRCGLFITGTDTGVGKTVVTTGLVRLLRRRGIAVTATKPLASGAEPSASGLIADDTRAITAALGLDDRAFATVTPWVYAEPLAPAVAARRAGEIVPLQAIVEHVETVANQGELVVVEGVGGLLCPITDDATCADLATALGLPMIIVARRSLGTLNHTLLTVEAATHRALPIAGVIVSETTPPTTCADQTNVAELRRLLRVPLLGVVPFNGDLTDDSAMANLDWRRVGRRL